MVMVLFVHTDIHIIYIHHISFPPSNLCLPLPSRILGKISTFPCTNTEMKTSTGNLSKYSMHQFCVQIKSSQRIEYRKICQKHLTFHALHILTKKRGKVRIMVCMLFVSFPGFGDKTQHSHFHKANQNNPKKAKTDSSPNLKPIIGPGPKLHDTGLFVEGKILDVDLAGRFVDGRGLPLHQPVVPQGRLRCQCYLKITVRAEKGKKQVRRQICY